MSRRSFRARPSEGDATVPAIGRDADVLAAHLEDAAHFPGGFASGLAWPSVDGEASPDANPPGRCGAFSRGICVGTRLAVDRGPGESRRKSPWKMRRIFEVRGEDVGVAADCGNGRVALRWAGAKRPAGHGDIL